MTDGPLLETVRPWIEGLVGVELSALSRDPVPVLAVSPKPDLPPLLAVKVGDAAVVLVTRKAWVDELQPIVSGLHLDMLFSTFGTYELSRATLRDGVSVFGPSWYLFGDESSVRPVDDDRPVRMEPSALADVDYDLFWHCIPSALAGFAVREKGELVALATVIDRGDPVWEIGMEVAPAAKGQGLGRAVVAAAARWILDSGRIVLATVGQFNAPSARTLRSAGLRYTFMELKGTPGPFRVPPQPLGRPHPGAHVYDYYPRWAMNHDILPRPGRALDEDESSMA